MLVNTIEYLYLCGYYMLFTALRLNAAEAQPPSR